MSKLIFRKSFQLLWLSERKQAHMQTNMQPLVSHPFLHSYRSLWFQSHASICSPLGISLAGLPASHTPYKSHHKTMHGSEKGAITGGINKVSG